PGLSASLMTFMAIVIAAPFFEEILFRGFIFEGLLRSKASWRGAIIITTLLWALLHVQYDLVGQMIIFGMGVLLGFARLYSGSVILPIILHIAFNGVQVMLQVMLYGELSL
ncbi:MAG: CPBP family intramembrane glutamic endopeptidase, partial [Alphaproteobacteria bacterium]|nr:CPBP family intramembrane glutamic endopeptidase [Alphaproteobacteria bacterium]